MRSGIPTRNSERIYAESYLDYKNNIFIFIEDTDETTRKIMLELIQRTVDSSIKIDRLHSMGGRTEVLEAFERRNINRTEIYIIDGDLYMLFENHNFQKGLVVFDRYCIENYLLDVNALNELLYQEALTINDKEKLIQNFDYLKSRISRKVNFELKVPSREILIPHNRILMSWVIENLVKNAVDAMKGEGKLEISLYSKNNYVLIDVKDSGSGMTNTQMRSAFKPGYSTKKRGWGLGLSLAKRVINEYHNGDIKIAESEVGKGTTFRIVLKA